MIFKTLVHDAASLSAGLLTAPLAEQPAVEEAVPEAGSKVI